MSAACNVMERAAALAEITDEPGRLTRTFLSPAMKRATDRVGGWMKDAGLEVRVDGAGNLIGHRPGPPGGGTLLIGSHLDTVRDAGPFDGPLGVLVGLAAIEALRGEALPFGVDLIGFSDEEGVRFQSTYLGSKALVGLLTEADLARKDADGVSVAEAIGNAPQPAAYEAAELLGYLEVHIEQGPVLEERGLSVGVVSAIAGQARVRVTLRGLASHAGTTPMLSRRDALAGAAELVLAIEEAGRRTAGLVATVGKLEAHPGASNVISGRVDLTIDVRHAEDAVREQACEALRESCSAVARRRRLELEWETVQAERAVPCSEALTALLVSAAEREGEVLRIPSGAGHDAVVMARIAPIAMLFVRCKGGLSHHPDESILPEDADAAVAVVCDFLRKLRP